MFVGARDSLRSHHPFSIFVQLTLDGDFLLRVQRGGGPPTTARHQHIDVDGIHPPYTGMSEVTIHLVD